MEQWLVARLPVYELVRSSATASTAMAAVDKVTGGRKLGTCSHNAFKMENSATSSSSSL